MEIIETIEDANVSLKPLVELFGLEQPQGDPEFSNERIQWWGSAGIVNVSNSKFIIGWLNVLKYGKDDVSLVDFEVHPKQNEYFYNDSETVLFLPVIEVNGTTVIDQQIIELYPGSACIMPAGVVHAPPFQNDAGTATMLVVVNKEVKIDPVKANKPVEFDM